jgi:hypothetical protein
VLWTIRNHHYLYGSGSFHHEAKIEKTRVADPH